MKVSTDGFSFLGNPRVHKFSLVVFNFTVITNLSFFEGTIEICFDLIFQKNVWQCIRFRRKKVKEIKVKESRLIDLFNSCSF